jgi:hypothetical protein
MTDREITLTHSTPLHPFIFMRFGTYIERGDGVAPGLSAGWSDDAATYIVQCGGYIPTPVLLDIGAQIGVVVDVHDGGTYWQVYDHDAIVAAYEDSGGDWQKAHVQPVRRSRPRQMNLFEIAG